MSACSEKGCPFPAVAGSTLCRQHARMAEEAEGRARAYRNAKQMPLVKPSAWTRADRLSIINAALADFRFRQQARDEKRLRERQKAIAREQKRRAAPVQQKRSRLAEGSRPRASATAIWIL